MFNPSKKFIGVETLKAYNPSTAHRRKERDAEKKKNKAERKVTREQTLLKRNPVVIKEELDKLEAIAKSGQPMTDGRSRRLQKLQQLWAQVVSAVEAERRVRTADVSSVAAGESRGGATVISYSRCLQQRLSHGERGNEEDEKRYYCPELCNTGIFRHPDGSVRPYPPMQKSNRFEETRRFVESQQQCNRERRGSPSSDEGSSESGSDDDSSSTAAGGSSSRNKAELEQEPEAAEDFLASIPLPPEPPPAEQAAAPSPASAGVSSAAPAVAVSYMPMTFPAPPPSVYGGAHNMGAPNMGAPNMGAPNMGAPNMGAPNMGAPNMGPLNEAATPGQSMPAAPGSPAFFAPGLIHSFAGVPAPPPQLLAQMHQQMPQPQPHQQQQRSPQPPPPPPPQRQQQQQQSPAAARNEPKRDADWRGQQQPPAKKQQTPSKPDGAADLKAVIAFVPTHLRTKKMPATAKVQEGPSISRVSAYSMGAGALGHKGGHSGSGGGEQSSGLARFLGEANRQKQGEATARAAKKAGPADLDKAFDEFLKEVGAA